jgi:hypothetical protein
VSEYPAHDKLKAHKAEADTCGRFYDFLRDEGILLARWTKIDGFRDKQLWPIIEPPDALIGAFLDISPEDLEREKRAMLEKLRAAHEEREASHG